MNRTDRQFGITVLLQSRPRLSADELSAAFGVSRSTIYRDVKELSASGVPIVTRMGQGFELREGAALPPLALTPGEAAALALGGQLLRGAASGRLTADISSALDKLTTILPEGANRQVQTLTGALTFIAPAAKIDLDEPRLASLQHAISERRVVVMRYHGIARDALTERAIEPLRLNCSQGLWYVHAWCRLREDTRSFRLSRIDSMAVLEETFEPRVETTAIEESDPLTVRVHFSPRVLRQVSERQHYSYQFAEPQPDGSGTIVEYRVDSPAEIIPWLLSWGPNAEVLEPPELRAAIREQALRLAELMA